MDRRQHQPYESTHHRAVQADELQVGAHPLLAYIVPDVWEHVVGLLGLDGAWWRWVRYFHDRGGTGGLWNAALVTALMLLLTAGLVRAGVRFRV